MAVRACLSESGFDELRPEALVAPRLLWSETSSSLHAQSWRGEISQELAAQALERLSTAPVAARTPSRLVREAWAVADELGWARTYDAEYVALARLLDCRLVTLDERLRRGADSVVDVLGPTEL